MTMTAQRMELVHAIDTLPVSGVVCIVAKDAERSLVDDVVAIQKEDIEIVDREEFDYGVEIGDDGIVNLRIA